MNIQAQYDVEVAIQQYNWRYQNKQRISEALRLSEHGHVFRYETRACLCGLKEKEYFAKQSKEWDEFPCPL